MNDVQKNFKKQINKGLKDLKKKDKNAYYEYVKWNHIDDVEERQGEEKRDKIYKAVTAPFKLLLQFLRIIIPTLIIIGLIMTINNANKSSNNDINKLQMNQSQINTSVNSKNSLELIDTKPVVEKSHVYISGTIRNNTEKKYSYVIVEINLYDASGSQIGSTSDTVENLMPGDTWKFKAICTEKEAKSYKIVRIRGL